MKKIKLIYFFIIFSFIMAFTTSCTSQIVYYKNFPEIPDFGIFVNANILLTKTADDGTTIFVYDLVTIDSSLLNQYLELLNELEFDQVSLDQKGISQNNLAMKSNKYSIINSFQDDKFIFSISENDINETFYSTTKLILEDSDIYYADFNGVPDFGKFAEVILFTSPQVQANTTVYVYAMDNIDIIKIQEYYNLIESLGYEYEEFENEIIDNAFVYFNDDYIITANTIDDHFYVSIMDLNFDWEDHINDYLNDGILSLEKYNKITIGMTYDQVKKIIGKPGTPTAESGIAGEYTHIIMYTWQGNGEIGSSGLFTFHGGILYSKVQTGLK